MQIKRAFFFVELTTGDSYALIILSRAKFAQSLKIALKDRVGLDAILQALQVRIQFALTFRRQGVDHPVLLVRGLDEATTAQVGQVFGNLNLWLFQDFLKMANAKGRLREQVQDAQARLIAQALVDLDQVHDRLTAGCDRFVFLVSYSAGLAINPTTLARQTVSMFLT